MGWKIFDCAETNVTCGLKNQPIEANPDIAGVGVIISFLMMTCLAFLTGFTVIFLDRYEQVINLYRRFVTKNSDVYEQNYNGPYWRSTAFWSRVLSKNLLALSDTQLLTGLAIQFTGLLKHCSMTVYHWKIVTELAFLTTVTHLLAVVALRNYFVKNRWINLPRIFFMLANLGLLGYTSFVAYSYELAGTDLDLSSDLACFFKRDRPRFTSAFGGKWATLLICAIGGHVTVILAMYFLKDPQKGGKKEWWYWIGAAFRTWIVAPIYAIYGIYTAGDGLQYTQALGTPNVNITSDDEKEWNFGQFLPVLLLALPLFAGWESFWEEKDEDRENRFGRHVNIRQTWHRGSNSPADGSDMQNEKNDGGVVMRKRRNSRSGSTEEREVQSEGMRSVPQSPRPDEYPRFSTTPNIVGTAR